jgi:hypothetical protein
LQPVHGRKRADRRHLAKILIAGKNGKRLRGALGKDNQGRVVAVNISGFTQAKNVQNPFSILNVNAGLLQQCGKLAGGDRPGNLHHRCGQGVKYVRRGHRR